MQVSGTSQKSAFGRHTVPFANFRSAGQFTPEPVQYSAASQVVPSVAKTAGLQTVEEDIRVLIGQELLAPLQVSALSQTPAAARQIVPEVLKLSAGQTGVDPVQVSAISHVVPSAAFTAARHT